MKKLIIPISIFLSLIISCTSASVYVKDSSINYRSEMRQFVIGLSNYARQTNPQFIVIPQNGQEVVWDAGDEPGGKIIYADYLVAVDGIGREVTFYGYKKDGLATGQKEVDYYKTICNPYKENEIRVLSIDYTGYDENAIVRSNKLNEESGYISFAAIERNLTVVPDVKYQPEDENARDILTLSDAKNFLYILNYENYTESGIEALLQDIGNTNYDLVVMDAFYADNKQFSKEQIESLKTKKNGGKRLVISYMSIGEAEDYRWYWHEEWKKTATRPLWLEKENPDWAGNYKVKYWNPAWQKIIYGGDDSYLKKILDAGFDGVYLDIIDAFEYFESKPIWQSSCISLISMSVSVDSRSILIFE